MQEWDAAADAASGLLPLLTDLQQELCLAGFLRSLSGSSDSEERASAARLIEHLAGRDLPPTQAEELLLPSLLMLAADTDVSVRQVVHFNSCTCSMIRFCCV